MRPFERLSAIIRGYCGQLSAARRTVTGQVSATVCDTVSAISYAFDAWKPTLTKLVKRALLVYAALVVFVVVLCCTVLSCMALAAVSAGTLRYLLVVNAPGNQLHTLDINVMSLFTEPWRLSSVQDEVRQFTVQPSPALPMPGNSSFPAWNAPAPRLSPAMEYLETEAAKMRLSFLSQYAQSIIGTSTLLIPSASRRAVFSKDGTVDVESLFTSPSPMFNGKGTYAAQLQLVFAREEHGRDVSIVVESQMLYANAANKPQPLRTLNVLFTKVHSVIVRTGDKERLFLMEISLKVLRLWFYVPVRLYEIAHYYLLESKDGMTFPPLLSQREVAVSIDLYSRFAPPTAVQARLRAVNFTVYQLLESGDSRLKLSRAHLFSMVQLSGVRYYLLQYPLLSFLLLSGGLFALYMSAACVSLLAATLFLYARLVHGRGASSSAALHTGKLKANAVHSPDDEWESSSENAEPHTRPAVRAGAKQKQ